MTGNPRAIDQRAWSSFATTSGLVGAYSDRRLLGPILSCASHLPSARWNTAPAPRARLAMPSPPSADGRDSPDCQSDCQSNRLAEVSPGPEIRLVSTSQWAGRPPSSLDNAVDSYPSALP